MRKHAKKSSFLCLCYILRGIRAGRCRERRYADHIFIQIYFRMHRPFRSQIFKILFASGGKGGIDPLTKILRTFLIRSTTDRSLLLPAGDTVNTTYSYSVATAPTSFVTENKKLSYCRRTARCVVSVEILPIATQQRRNYLYDKILLNKSKYNSDL